MTKIKVQQVSRNQSAAGVPQADIVVASEISLQTAFFDEDSVENCNVTVEKSLNIFCSFWISARQFEPENLKSLKLFSVSVAQKRCLQFFAGAPRETSPLLQRNTLGPLQFRGAWL